MKKRWKKSALPEVPRLVWEYESIGVDLLSDGRDTLDTWIPPDPLDVAIDFNIHVGEQGCQSREIFFSAIYTTAACTREGWSLREIDRSIVVNTYDWPDIKPRVDRIIRSCERLTSFDSSVELRTYFRSEFERPDGGSRDRLKRFPWDYGFDRVDLD